MAKKQFKAESKRLLDLMINSIYTHKEIFLREIISNASDAIDKLAYLALTDQNVGLNRDDFKIEIKADAEHRILTVSDNGIGMSADEMEENLGTIAKSGSLKFKSEMEKTEDVDIIGQFGVGFYSAFMVADHIQVISKKYGEQQAYMWESSGAEGYTVTPCERDGIGTDVVMKLKEDAEGEDYSRFLQTYELRSLIRKYSDYIRYPIRMEVEKERKKEGCPEDKPEYETYREEETLNSMVPLWQRNKKELTEADYNSFYHEKFYDFEDPAATLHINAEGTISYQALLFIPKRAPYDFYTKDFKKGLQLYSSGVMIMDACEELLPDHFRFVRGIVDSQDLSLNISREMLQHDRQLAFIAKNLEKKIKAELLRLLENEREKYEGFWSAFGRQLKYGVVSDYGAHKELLQDLLLFHSYKQDKLITLKEYADAMPEGQKHIYFASGESVQRLAKLPQLDKLNEKGYDVLFFTEEVDEFIPQTLQSYAEKEFKNIAKDDLELATEEEKAKAEQLAQEKKPLLDFVKQTLGERVKEVRVSAELGSHAVCVVPDGGMSFEMEKYFKRVNPEMAMEAGRILELNPEHPAVAAMLAAMDTEPQKAKDYAELLYGQALLMADLPMDDPTHYADLVCSLM